MALSDYPLVQEAILKHQKHAGGLQMDNKAFIRAMNLVREEYSLPPIVVSELIDATLNRLESVLSQDETTNFIQEEPTETH